MSRANTNGECVWPGRSSSPGGLDNQVPAPSQGLNVCRRKEWSPWSLPSSPRLDWGAAWTFQRWLQSHLPSHKLVCRQYGLAALSSGVGGPNFSPGLCLAVGIGWWLMACVEVMIHGKLCLQRGPCRVHTLRSPSHRRSAKQALWGTSPGESSLWVMERGC